MAYGQIIGAGVIWFVAIWGRLLGAEPFTTWLYFFAWWPLLLFLDGLLACLTSKSLIWQRPKDFLRMALFSVTVWLTFEVFNLWLLNWRYVGVEPIPWLRWPGYALAFATVLPGVLLTAEVQAAMGAGPTTRGSPATTATGSPNREPPGEAPPPRQLAAGLPPGRCRLPDFTLPGPILCLLPHLAGLFLSAGPTGGLDERRFPHPAPGRRGAPEAPVPLVGRAFVRALVGTLELSFPGQVDLHSAGPEFRKNL
ncbi:MAG: hypothetical protein P8X49_07735 [Syntrophobacterales bacterium]